ncbi:hypothetical protein PA598K_01464 [Paenibacillus sp. 598K]|uniref:DUF7667 family protein n=1 Tax=Paenibacillus sp. 598K TaxID=1117987 RepID=UPI000FFA3090|nr:hypothetical protein [Paenibacillus sp. 598K]GBF73179.1 hypothetical protein PA598K_01464 [Paenibacillus sp. 598K]
MIGIHAVHRRMAGLISKSRQLGGLDKLSDQEQRDLYHCLIVNADTVVKLDSYKQLSFYAATIGDIEWQHDICAKIEAIETQLI